MACKEEVIPTTSCKTAPTAPAIPKPKLKGIHTRIALVNLCVASALAVVTAFSVKVFRNDERRKDYLRFYANYDAMKSFNRMKEAGLLQSCRPDRETMPKKK